MNKGLEVIEAHHLFGFDYKNIDVVIPPLWCCTDNAAMLAMAAYYSDEKISELVAKVDGVGSEGEKIEIVVQEESWEIKNNISVAVQRHSSAAVGDKVYIISGADAAGYNFTKCTIYDTTTDKCTNATGIPAHKNFFGISVVDDKIYARDEYSLQTINEYKKVL